MIKISSLSGADRWLLVQIVALVVFVRVALWFITLKRLQALLSRLDVGGRRKTNSGVVPVERVAQWVAAVSRYIPRATCLTQALVTATLLRRAGHPATIRFGVSRPGARFRAHAWVECEGKIVIGRIKDFDDFAPLPALQRPVVGA